MVEKADPDRSRNFPEFNKSAREIEGYFGSKSILRELILQLRKDFTSAGVPVKLLLSHKYSFEELILILKYCLEDQNGKQISLLLNRVDISEKQFVSGMPGPGLDTLALAELIIKRELQKVVLRQLFSKSSK